MNYLAIKDLKKTREIREVLEAEREVVLTRDGQPFAVMVSVSPGTVEDALAEIRRAMFSQAVMQARRQVAGDAPTAADVTREVRARRRERRAP